MGPDGVPNQTRLLRQADLTIRTDTVHRGSDENRRGLPAGHLLGPPKGA
ncbi:hypothetical protein ABZ172_26925 [Streptomyces sp. NPDC006296]